MSKEETKTKDNSFGVAAAVLGILSIISSFIPIIGLILGIISLIFGIKQKNIMRNRWSKAGIILSIIGIILAIIIWASAIYLLNNSEFISQLQQLQQLNQ